MAAGATSGVDASMQTLSKASVEALAHITTKLGSLLSFLDSPEGTDPHYLHCVVGSYVNGWQFQGRCLDQQQNL